MAKSYEQIQAQIEKLQREAGAIRAKELTGVVAQIKTLIDQYQLTPADLFGSETRAVRGSAKVSRKRAAPKARGAASHKAGAPKYRDEAGNTWTGHGKRPNWYKEAIAAGKSPEDLLIKG